MRTVEIRDITKDFEDARSLVETFLKRNRVSDVIVSETMVIFEALCHNIYEQQGENTVLTVTGKRRFGGAGIIINFEGDMYISDQDYPGEPTPEDRILSAYGDRIDYIYSSRFNSIRIMARRSYVGASIAYMMAVLLALVVYAVMHTTAGAEVESTFRTTVVFPLETLFTNAMMMIGAPVTFLSLLKNLTGTYILSERDSGMRELTRRTLASSAISVLLAIVMCRITYAMSSSIDLMRGEYGNLHIQFDLGDFIMGLMPSDILTPFMTISPFPLILLAAIFTYAFCSVGKYFDKMINAINVCYALFSRMLTIIMSTLPIFTFFAILDILLVESYDAVIECGKLILIIIVSLILPVLYYMLRLAARGISIPKFAKRLRPMLGENFKIASAIDAVPYNIRYCMKNFGLDRKKLEVTMPVLAQINLDGNCYVLTLIAGILFMFSGSGFQLGELILIGVLIFVLSLGAPNQPGSCIIGILIIIHYLGAYALIPFAFFAEVFFGGLLNLMNVTGDVVTVVTKERPNLRD
ncbi:MAG: cation:dicarboxylase symporter family transporter [Mogibacterium sp.]|nr:cation:dicarboxylase symporter family transporter [Mogibacterium sp.]